MSRQEGKVFVGGLSWETTDVKLKQYFENFGSVQEAFVSYDRHTGRPRGFGFVVFVDPQVADKVTQQLHTIDRREVEAKKALPKEESPVSKDLQAVASGQRTKKIFVGGLAGTVDEPTFREYFEAFGKVEDAVVMYDHDNKRPRGFGFITFAEEEAVEAVFSKGTLQTIHEKQIEIKRAIPRDTGPLPSPKALYRSPQTTYGYRTPQSGKRPPARVDGTLSGSPMHPIHGIDPSLASGSGAPSPLPMDRLGVGTVVTGIPASMMNSVPHNHIGAGEAHLGGSEMPMPTQMQGIRPTLGHGIGLQHQQLLSPGVTPPKVPRAPEHYQLSDTMQHAGGSQLESPFPAVDPQHQVRSIGEVAGQTLSLTSMSEALERLQQTEAVTQSGTPGQSQETQGTLWN